MQQLQGHRLDIHALNTGVTCTMFQKMNFAFRTTASRYALLKAPQLPYPFLTDSRQWQFLYQEFSHMRNYVNKVVLYGMEQVQQTAYLIFIFN